VHHIGEVTILFVRLDAGVVDVGNGAEVLNLGLAILVGDEAALLGSEGKEFAFLGSGETLEVSNTALHL